MEISEGMFLIYTGVAITTIAVIIAIVKCALLLWHIHKLSSKI